VAVLCATMGGHIFALDRSTGHPIWVFSAGTHAVVTSSPSLSPDGSTLYVAVQGANQQFSGYLLALSATGGGKVLWKVKVGSVDGSSPAVASAAGDGTIYIGSLDSHLHVTSQPDARYACLSCSCSRSPSLWPKHALNASTFGQEHPRVHAEYVHMLQCLSNLLFTHAHLTTPHHHHFRGCDDDYVLNEDWINYCMVRSHRAVDALLQVRHP
jgi:hypothetical protein